MSRRLLILVATATTCLLFASAAASASGFGGTNGTTSAGASAAGGKVTVGVGVSGSSPPAAPASSSTPHGTPGSAGDAPAADQVICTTAPIQLPAFQRSAGIGGSMPGYWAFNNCTGPDASPPRVVWIVINQPGTPPTPGPNTVTAPPPVVVAQQAVKQLALPAGTIEMAPPTSALQLVNVRTWLWVAPAMWKPYTKSASLDGVAATATATPEQVIWNMGDGDTVTCDGPGTPYNAAEPNAPTDCSYTWTQPSDNQPGALYQVTATIEWHVTWTAVGAPGGGDLGLIAGPADHLAVGVTESQALNTPTDQPATNASGTGGS